jgi:hypothetical protein
VSLEVSSGSCGSSGSGASSPEPMSATTGTRWPPLPTMAAALKTSTPRQAWRAAETALLAFADSATGKRYTAVVATRPRSLLSAQPATRAPSAQSSAE